MPGGAARLEITAHLRHKPIQRLARQAVQKPPVKAGGFFHAPTGRQSVVVLIGLALFTKPINLKTVVDQSHANAVSALENRVPYRLPPPETAW
jgi:hypothetical protein